MWKKLFPLLSTFEMEKGGKPHTCTTQKKTLSLHPTKPDRLRRQNYTKAMNKLALLTIAALSLSLSACKDMSEIVSTPISSQYTEILNLKEPVSTLPCVTTGVETIIVPERPTPYDFYSLIDTIRYIKLETWSDCPIGSVDKILTDASQMFILDKKNRAVYRFSESGKYLGRVGAYGYGAGEYQGVQDIALNTKAQTITLLDTRSAALLVYDYEGRFVKSMPLYYYFYKIAYVGDKLAQHTDFGNNSRLAPVDRHRLVISTPDAQGTYAPTLAGFPYAESLRDAFHWVSGNPLQQVGGEVFFHHVPSDTIWEVTENACRARYRLTFADRTGHGTPDLDTDEKYEAYTRTHRHFSGMYTYTRNHVCFLIGQQNKAIEPMFFDRHSRHLRFGFGYATPGHNLLEYIRFNDFQFSDGEYFIRVIKPAELLRSLKQQEELRRQYPELKTTQFTPQDLTLIKSLHEEDNPILIKVKLKAF